MVFIVVKTITNNYKETGIGFIKDMFPTCCLVDCLNREQLVISTTTGKTFWNRGLRAI